MTAYLETLLCDVFKAQGLKHPERAARRATEAFDIAKRNERIYEATKRSSHVEVAAQFHISERQVERIVRAYLLTVQKIA